MKYKLIAFDLDGTLLDGRKQVSPENLRALEAAAESGAVVAAATGRIIGGIPEEIRSLPFLRYYISVNGAYVYDTLEDRVLYRGEIPVKMALALCRYMDALPVQEETGLNIRSHQLCGIKDWCENQCRFVVLLYKATCFDGELRSSPEGRVWWEDIADLPKLKLSFDMRDMLRVFTEEALSEFFYYQEGSAWKYDLK